MCRTNIVGLIHTTRFVVKSWRMLVPNDSRKRKSYRLNRPVEGCQLKGVKKERYSNSRCPCYRGVRLIGVFA